MADHYLAANRSLINRVCLEREEERVCLAHSVARLHADSNPLHPGHSVAHDIRGGSYLPHDVLDPNDARGRGEADRVPPPETVATMINPPNGGKVQPGWFAV